jgi:hypothetical protein
MQIDVNNEELITLEDVRNITKFCMKSVRNWVKGVGVAQPLETIRMGKKNIRTTRSAVNRLIAQFSQLDSQQDSLTNSVGATDYASAMEGLRKKHGMKS